MNKHIFLIVSIVALCGISTFCWASIKRSYTVPSPYTNTFGTLHQTVIEVGPIYLDRKFRSMEGPGVHQKLKAGDLLSSDKIVLPESLLSKSSLQSHPTGLIEVGSLPRVLYWLKGVKIETLDKKGNILPNASFLCHADLFISHRGLGSAVSACSSSDALCLTSGLTKIILPAGFGIPTTDTGIITVSMRALNLSAVSSKPSIKFRLTLYSIRDRDLKSPLKALNWCRADIIEPVKDSAVTRSSHSCCSTDCVETTAEDAPNQWKHKIVINQQGQKLSKHWLVPPGRHVYQDSISDERVPGFALNGPVQAAWLHAHPYCQSVSLVEHLNHTRRIVFTVHCRTAVSSELQLSHIDYLTFSKGVPLNTHASYGLEAVYDNPSNTAVDAMVELGILFHDLKFKKPQWALNPALHTVVVEMGPYKLQRKYKIMEGPYAETTFRINKALDRTVTVPATQVCFVENENVTPQSSTPAQQTSWSIQKCWSVPQMVQALQARLFKMCSLVHNRSPAPGDLYWFTGARVDAIDEKGHVLPKPIYLCHGRLDIFSALHKRFFPNSTPIPNGRICLFTQGCNVITFPQGYGVPVAGGEKMRVNLKALNLSSNTPKQIKLRCTIFLLKDKELNHPMSPLNWQITDVLVKLPPRSPAQKHNMHNVCPSLCCMSTAEDAPNNVTHWRERDSSGNSLTGHWIVPPGQHVYSVPITAPKNAEFALSGPIRAAWAHVHPFCNTLSLVEVLNGRRRITFSIHALTTTATGARLTHIDLLNVQQGLPLNPHASYYLTTTYNNTSGKPQDSMAIAGIFFSDLKFKMPAWAHINRQISLSSS